MTNLPPIPKDRDWSPETWRAGLDEAVRRAGYSVSYSWETLCKTGCLTATMQSTIAHATSLLDAGIVKPVVSEGEQVYNQLQECMTGRDQIAVIDAALVKARAGG